MKILYCIHLAQLFFIPLFKQLLTAKKKDPNADTSTIEKQIDEMVYALYGPAYRSGRLTPEEIAIVEGKGTDKSLKSYT